MMFGMEGRTLVGATWRKSSRTVSKQCVEVAMGDAVVGVRDSKDRAGAVLVFSSRRWTDFVTTLRRRQYRPRM
jgi:hypothetical protein